MFQLTDDQFEGLKQLRAEVQWFIQRRLMELGIDRPLMGCVRGLGSRGTRFPNKHGPQPPSWSRQSPLLFLAEPATNVKKGREVP